MNRISVRWVSVRTVGEGRIEGKWVGTTWRVNKHHKIIYGLTISQNLDLDLDLDWDTITLHFPTLVKFHTTVKVDVEDLLFCFLYF